MPSKRGHIAFSCQRRGWSLVVQLSWLLSSAHWPVLNSNSDIKAWSSWLIFVSHNFSSIKCWPGYSSTVGEMKRQIEYYRSSASHIKRQTAHDRHTHDHTVDATAIIDIISTILQGFESSELVGSKPILQFHTFLTIESSSRRSFIFSRFSNTPGTIITST